MRGVYPQASIYPRYMLRDNCTPTFPRLMKWSVMFLRVILMSLKLPLFSFCERSQLDLLNNASCGLCVKQKLKILLRTNHSGACARRKRHVLRFMTSRPKRNIPLMCECGFVVIALFDSFMFLSFERVSIVLALNKVPYI